MWRWVDPNGRRSPTGFRTMPEAQAAALKVLTGKEPSAEHVAVLWQPCERAGWKVEFVT